MSAKHLVCVLMFVGLLAGSGFVQAETLYSCNFESSDYTLGDSLVGQDSWQRSIYDIYRNPIVGSGVGINTSQVFCSNSETSSGWITSAALRPFSTPLKFNSDDTAIEFHFWGCSERGTGTQVGNIALTMMWEGKDMSREVAVGIYYTTSSASKPKAWYRDGNRNMIYGDTLEPGHWYEIKAEMDFSALCADGVTYGKLNYSYRDITNEETSFTPDSVIQGKDMNLTPDAFGDFQSNNIYAQVTLDKTWVQHTFIDNISVIDPVPEPSSLALLACGLVSLLAYAWRKRK